MYSRVVGTFHLPQEDVDPGDLAAIVEYAPHSWGGKEGAIMEILDTLGNSLGVVTVPASTVGSLTRGMVPTARSRPLEASMHEKRWLAITEQTHQTYQAGQPRRFALRYDGWMRALAYLTALGPRWSHVDLSADELQVRMGWGFEARLPRRSIIQARQLDQQLDIWYVVGIHTLRGGRWIMNGSLQGVVTLEIEPPVRARAFGLPIRLRRLAMSLRDPDGFLAALGAPTV